LKSLANISFGAEVEVQLGKHLQVIMEKLCLGPGFGDLILNYK